jgi:hypothetical protein
VAAFIDEHQLAGTDIDLIGVCLLLSAVRNGDRLWTFDRKVRTTAQQLKVAFVEIEDGRVEPGFVGARRRKHE